MTPWTGTDRRTKKKMLYVDDCKDDLTIMSHISHDVGLEFKGVQKGTEFLNEFETGSYDFALIDYSLELIDGVTLSRMLDRSKAPNTKIYFVSAHESSFVERAINGDKFNGVFNKLDGYKTILMDILRKDFSNV